MGRPNSCFKIITCAGDSDNEENHAVSESKGPSDKRGWSFRKKSARHRVLSNTVITETASSANKESLESASLNFKSSVEPAILEKDSVLKDTDEKSQLSMFLDTKASQPVLDPNAVDAKPSKPVLDTSALDAKVSEPVLDTNEVDAKVSEAVLDPNYVEPRVSETVVDTTTLVDGKSDTVHDLSSVDNKVSETEIVLDEENKTKDVVDLKESETESLLGALNKTEDFDLESAVKVIQTVVRAFLAQKELVKRKNVVKLQAAVRGHLVRQHAVGTLRCVQAVIKMQALVRSRRAQIASKESYAEDKSGGKCEKDEHQSNIEQNDILSNKSNVMSTSVEKILSNRFARQLLESSPKTKSIKIKCDSSKPNSAWNWLERWMSISTTKSSPDTESITQHHKGETHDYISQVDAKVCTEASYESDEVNSDVKKTTMSTESKEKPITSDAQSPSYDINSFSSTSPRDDLKLTESEIKSVSDREEISEVIDSVSNHILSLDANSQMEIDSVPSSRELGSDEQPMRSMERSASEELQTEGKKSVYGSRKVSNPAFIAAHSKFEEPTLTAKSSRSNGSFSRADGAEFNVDTVSSGADYSESRELGVVDNSAPSVSIPQVGGSECGTELSISSTLDSPDRSEVEVIERDSEDKHSKELFQSTNIIEYPEVEDQVSSAVPVSNSSQPVSNQQKLDNSNREINESAVANNFYEQKKQPEVLNLDQSVVTEDSYVPEDQPGRNNLDQTVVIEDSHMPEKKHGKINMDQYVVIDDSQEPKQESEVSNLDLQRNVGSKIGNHANILSPEASPDTRATVNENQVTPSSQISVKSKSDGSGKRGSSNKRKSLSTSKLSPSNQNHSSGRKGTVEQSSKEQEAGKRRNSFGSTKPEDIDNEAKDSNSSVPRFMQATESARAKVHASNSPRSSPDVNEKETHIKKRHSLPGATGRQGSPRINRITSQAQQSAKGNSSRSPQERKWLR